MLKQDAHDVCMCTLDHTPQPVLHKMLAHWMLNCTGRNVFSRKLISLHVSLGSTVQDPDMIFVFPVLSTWLLFAFHRSVLPTFKAGMHPGNIFSRGIQLKFGERRKAFPHPPHSVEGMVSGGGSIAPLSPWICPCWKQVVDNFRSSSLWNSIRWW